MIRKKQLRNQKLNLSSKKHNRDYSKRINKESAKSVLTVSSGTPCDVLNGLHKQGLNRIENILIGYVDINCKRNKFSSFKDLDLNETDICLSPETKTDERYKMFLKDRNNNGNGLILYTNEGILGKLINSCDFKEGSEVKVFEFSMSNKKWLLLGNYKPSSKMNCLP